VAVALGRTKTGRRQRAAEPAPRPEPAEPDHELEGYLAALNPEESVETTGSGRRFGGSQVYQLRLPLMANEQLKEMAARQGTSPGALARDWVLQHLQSEPAPEPPVAQAPQAPRGPSPMPAWPQEAPVDHGQQYADQYNPDQQYAGGLHSTDPYAQQGFPGYDQTDSEITMPRRY
jgi:hypothetical protein